MPKQLYKITQFHGGLNSNSDARDIAENELSEATDVMVDELGKVRMMGGTVAHKADINAVTGWTGTLIEGLGLFYFSHDKLGAEDSGSGENSTGDNYLAIYDDNDQQVWIYSEVSDDAGGTGWDDKLVAGGGVIDIGSTGSAHPSFYYADGALRVSDGNFGADNETKWYGYIDRTVLGDGVDGYDGYSGLTNGVAIDRWHEDEAAPKSLAIKDFATYGEDGGSNDNVTVPDASYPIGVEIFNWPYNYSGLISGDMELTSAHETCRIKVAFDSSSPNLSIHSGTNTTAGLANFASPGDHILITNTDSDANDGVFTVAAVSANATDPNTMDFDEAIVTDSNDTVYMHNLSRMAWYSEANPNIELAVSTLYDESKQESPLRVFGTVLEPHHWTDGIESGLSKTSFRFYLFAGDSTTDGVPFSDPRVTGFNVYMRHEGTGTWYQQFNIDMTQGIKRVDEDTYTMWSAAKYESSEVAKAGGTSPTIGMSKIITYEDSAGMSGSTTKTALDGTGTGFKTSVIANRMAYIGNVRAKDSSGNAALYPDAILKSQIGKFDSFSLDRRLEAAISDGDSIVKLEEYADRLLEFKKNKMTLINISQEVEFVEDIFIHKGVNAASSVCKTDFGIAWANHNGVYLYDGQKVNNLLEKGGRQIIKESEWFSFMVSGSASPMVGYMPTKRQIIVIDDNGTRGTGAIYLYDIVTQSWVKGAAATIDNQTKTNLITDWDNNLVYAHTAGTVVKWSDTAASSTTMVMSTKDIDFGNPGQKKTVYKVIVTYQSSNATTNVQLDYGVDGDTTFAYDFTVPELPAANGWQTAELVPDVQSEASNIKSFRLRFATDGTVPAGFEINDVSIVYRLKGAR